MPGPAIRSPTGSVDQRTMRRIRVSCLLPVRATVVIPTLDASELLLATLASLERQTVPVGGRRRRQRVDRRYGRGGRRAASRASGSFETSATSASARPSTAPRSRSTATLSCSSTTTSSASPTSSSACSSRSREPDVGMVAGVLLQAEAPDRIDSAGIELDTTLRSWDYLWNEPVSALAAAGDPVGPCGGAAAYRLRPFQELGGFDETLFAYWEDVDLALRFRAAGWTCALAPGARALHEHGQTLGAAFAGGTAARGVRSRLRARQVPRRAAAPADAGEDRAPRPAGARRPPRRPPRGGADPGAATRAGSGPAAARRARAAGARHGGLRRGASPTGGAAQPPLPGRPAGALRTHRRLT